MSQRPIPGARLPKQAWNEPFQGALFGLAPGEVFHAPSLTRRAVGSYPAFSPLPRPLRAVAVCSLWHCLSRRTLTRRSRVYPRPCRGYAAPRPVEFGLSSRGDATSDPPPLRNVGDPTGFGFCPKRILGQDLGGQRGADRSRRAGAWRDGRAPSVERPTTFLGSTPTSGCTALSEGGRRWRGRMRANHGPCHVSRAGFGR